MGRRILDRVKRPWAGALVGLVFLVLACGSPQTPPADVQKAKTAVEGSADPSPVKRPDIGFASRQKLVEHYKKHGREFGTLTMEQYLKKAQELRDRPAGGAILESVRHDGVVSRYDRETGDFLASNRDGIIRTYFRPTDGEKYYQRQLRRKYG
jgi:pyocin large subunit-like protein